MDLNEVLNPPQGGTVETPQEQPQQQEIAEGGEGGTGAPTTPQANETHVPLAALEAERKGRQDWKEKAIRAEAERDALRNAQQPQAQPQQLDPLQTMQRQLINERFNTSEMLARQKYTDMDEKLAVFQEAARQDPALMLALQSQNHPWEYAYKHAERLLLQREIGDDPKSYRAKVEAEIRAKIASEAAQVAAPAVPASLNGARSVAARSAPAWTGPLPISDILGPR